MNPESDLLVHRWGSTLVEAMRREALRVRDIQKFVGNDHSFGILSAYKELPKSVNKERLGRLLSEIERRGYRHHPLKATWTSEGTGRLYKEWSAVVPDIAFSDLLDLAGQYQQDAVIYKDPSGTLGMYHLKRHVANISTDGKGDIKYEVKADPEGLYSKDRGISFSFDFLWGQDVPWDGRTPIQKKDVLNLLSSGSLKP